MQKAKTFRLMKVAEEAAEIVQAVCKIQNYGEVSVVGDHTYHHKAHLESEIGDFMANLKFLIDGGYLDSNVINARIEEKTAYLIANDNAINIAPC